MKYISIEKWYIIPGTERELYFELNNTNRTSIGFYFNPPFTYRGFELVFTFMWVSFGIQWNIPN